MKPRFWISRETARIALIVSVPLALLLGPNAILRAQTALKKWAAGDALTSKDLNDNFEALRASIPATATNFEFIYVNAPAPPAVDVGDSYPEYTWSVSCPAGKRVLGGGCHAGNPEWLLWINAPKPDFSGWDCNSKNVSNGFTASRGTGYDADKYKPYAWAICANVP